jgi:nucleoside phosphorylase
LIQYSEYFDAGQWAKTDVDLTTNHALSPEGKMNASLWEFTTTNTLARIQYVLGGVTAGATYTQSYYIKSLSGDLTLRIGTSGAVVGEYEDITATSEWQRFEFTSVASGTTEYPRIQNISGTQGAQILVYGAQIEAGNYVSSYIPTMGTSETRAVDSFTKTGISSLINSQEGVFFVEMAALSSNTGTSLLSLSDGSATNNIYIGFTSTTNQLSAVLYANGSAQGAINTFSYDVKQMNKIAVSYKTNEFKLFVNGSLVGTDTSATMPNANALNEFSSDFGQNSFKLSAKLKQAIVFNEALTDAECVTLTTL